ncbi:MAG: hypothetical protein J6K20_15160 [Thermoguttaceae bacterium]|nr:hypothetical protein [Thermoguttaceae bacterium]
MKNWGREYLWSPARSKVSSRLTLAANRYRRGRLNPAARAACATVPVCAVFQLDASRRVNATVPVYAVFQLNAKRRVVPDSLNARRREPVTSGKTKSARRRTPSFRPVERQDAAEGRSRRRAGNGRRTRRRAVEM